MTTTLHSLMHSPFLYSSESTPSYFAERVSFNKLRIDWSKRSSVTCLDSLVSFTCNHKGPGSNVGLTEDYRQTFTAHSQILQKLLYYCPINL
jgi:hypothetical protein